LLRKLFRYNEIYMGLRDNHRFYYDRIWWLLRRVYLEKGRRLHRRSLLGQPDDVFFLVRKEIAEGKPIDDATAHVGESEKANWQLFDTANAHNVSLVYRELEWE